MANCRRQTDRLRWQPLRLTALKAVVERRSGRVQRRWPGLVSEQLVPRWIGQLQRMMGATKQRDRQGCLRDDPTGVDSTLAHLKSIL
jgi:hypothetical protein